jgi:ATP-dependent Clp protease ATP-binding subunit ClpC
MTVFRMLEKPDLIRIVDLEIKKVAARIEKKQITLDLDTGATELLIEEGYDPQYGARPMRRAVERFLEDPFAEALLRGEIKAGDAIDVIRKGTEKALEFKVRAKTAAADEPVAAPVE